MKLLNETMIFGTEFQGWN